MIDEVLFSLLKRVREGSEQQPPGTDAATSTAGLMVHHSRNTAAKQWDETKAITLSGVVRVFCKTAAMTTRTSDFANTWPKLMGVIKIQAGDATNEVSLSGALALQVGCKVHFDSHICNYCQEIFKFDAGKLDATAIWSCGWETWIFVATETIKKAEVSQKFLTAMIDALLNLLK